MSKKNLLAQSSHSSRSSKESAQNQQAATSSTASPKQTRNVITKRVSLTLIQAQQTQKDQSTPSDQSARSSQNSNSTKGGGSKNVVFNMMGTSQIPAYINKGKKSSKTKTGAKGSRIGRGAATVINTNQDETIMTTQTSSSNASVDVTPQRSRSEAPNGNSIGNVLYEEVHNKLMSRGRRLSPAKLQAKQQQRQQKAEHLRAKIELSRTEWCKKVRQRQQLARTRFQETVERKRLNLQDRLRQAARNKEAELQNVVEKAKAENEKAEETKYIVKLTKQSQQLDLSNKLSDNEERRKQQLLKDLERIKGQELKREAANKRREELSEEIRTKILSKEQKREQAEQRRRENQIAEKNKALAEKTKRDQIRARKHVKRHKISDIMSFVSNRESLWEFIGMEQDLDSMGLQFNLDDEDVLKILEEEVGGVRNLNENELLNMIQQDQFELEKLMLKRDHEILNACLIEEPDGSLKVLKSPLTLLQQQRGGPRSISSNSSDLSAGDRVHKKHSNSTLAQPSNVQQPNEDVKYFSPMKQSSAQASSIVETVSSSKPSDLRKLKYATKQHSQSFKSNLSSNQASTISKDDIMTQDEEEERKNPSQHQSEMSKSVHTIKDEKFEQMLHQQRLKVAVRRNILKRNLSEDLDWAAGLQSNTNLQMVRFVGQQNMHNNHEGNWFGLEVKSQTSSIERNSFSSLEDLEPVSKADTKGKHGKTSAANISKKNRNKGGRKRQSSKSSFHSSGQPNMQGLSGGSKDLGNMMSQLSGRGTKRNSIADLQQNFATKQKKTLSNNGSCSSLSSLIKTKTRQEDNDDDRNHQPTGTLNQAQLEQLGPVRKMPINGLSFGPQTAVSYPYNHITQASTGSQDGGNIGDDHLSQRESILSSSTATGQSFQLNSLIINQRPVPSKINLSSSLHMSNTLSKNANQHLFPIREQKIILMYKESETEFHFVQARITVKLEEVKLADSIVGSSLPLSTNQSTPQQSTSGKKASAMADDSTDKPQPGSSPATPQKGQYRHGAEETKRTPTKSNRTMDSNNTPGSDKKDRNLARSGNPSSILIGDTPLVEPFMDETMTNSVTQQSDRMVNLIVRKLLLDQMQHIRIDDSQKSILFDKDKDSQTVLKYLEVNELQFKYCRLCEVAIYSEYSASSDAEEAKASIAITEHFLSKPHIRKRDSLSIKENEDIAYSLLIFSSQPGEIELELRKENEKALKRKVKRLKTTMQALAVSHENASTYPGKELKSSNKNRLQIRCIELQKSVFPDIKYETVDSILNDVLKVLEKRGPGDLHLMRKLKFVPSMIDMICKRISTCPRAQLAKLAKQISTVIKILNKFCTLRENRNYMIQTNRLIPLIDLLSWCLNRQTELFFGIEFMPGLFQIMTTHLKHRVPYECQLLKEHMVELLICSQIPFKLKNKLAIVKSFQNNENEDSLGQVPFFLLKSVAFLEALTAIISIDARTRPVYEKSHKIGEHVFFVLQTTELLGITQMITTLLLSCNETFKASDPSSTSGMVLPQTILSLTIFSIKVLCNMMRMDVGVIQHMMTNLNEQLYHLLSFILSYTESNIDQNDDVKELLHETLIFIGYFCLLNVNNQKILHRGENCILQKLCNLPFTYFMDKKLKEILFPTLITASYLNERSVAIMDQEMNMNEILVKYIELSIQEELPRIMEQEQEYFSDHTKSMSSFGRARSPSQHSTGSNSNQSVQMDFLSGNNPYLPLVMRFPKHLWKDAAQYFKSKAD